MRIVNTTAPLQRLALDAQAHSVRQGQGHGRRGGAAERGLGTKRAFGPRELFERPGCWWAGGAWISYYVLRASLAQDAGRNARERLPELFFLPYLPRVSCM
jgi:hypothetical protein